MATGVEEATLRLRNVTKDDSGNYTCEAKSHEEAKNKTEIFLNVNYPPEGTGLKFSYVNASATLTCNADALPLPTYKILRNGTVIATGKIFTIHEITNSSVGNYTCCAENFLGRSCSITRFLTIKKKFRNGDCNCKTEWYIILVILASGFIAGILFSYIVSYSRRKFKSRKSKSKPEPPTPQVDSTYQELVLKKMNKEDNYQTLRVNAVRNDGVNDDESNYTELNKVRDVDDNYQSLT
ncbi:inactive tyrosine-protein kinase 7-like [Dendronephthya gigantea]|uniref:inactive tyrosine-protein kinase 7-like n=1 Tax=Dendronephthya gigantea TaxID=151771 RepID=UPI001069C65F|nr:inactive tyrosine-protein kinase 7-like [Dendronephthya gigantea]